MYPIWNNYKIKVNMLQYLLLEHIKVNKSLKINEIEKAPEWDGHTSDDVIKRIIQWIDSL